MSSCLLTETLSRYSLSSDLGPVFPMLVVAGVGWGWGGIQTAFKWV